MLFILSGNSGGPCAYICPSSIHHTPVVTPLIPWRQPSSNLQESQTGISRRTNSSSCNTNPGTVVWGLAMLSIFSPIFLSPPITESTHHANFCPWACLLSGHLLPHHGCNGTNCLTHLVPCLHHHGSLPPFNYDPNKPLLF